MYKRQTFFFTRQLYAGHTAETELFAVIDHPLCAQLHSQLYHTRIDRKFYNILKRYQSHAFPVPIAYRTDVYKRQCVSFHPLRGGGSADEEVFAAKR